MSRLEPALADYLALRRSLGFGLVRAGRLLTQFTAFLEARGQDAITLEAALAWATLPEAGGSRWLAMRLSVVRGFAAHLHALDPAHELIPGELLRDRGQRATPYLYTDAEIAALMDAARTLRTPFGTATYTTLIGLLAAAGLRVGEAIRLDRGDLDVLAGTLTIWMSKFGKSRLVPLHPTTVAALHAYLHRSDRPHPERRSKALLLSSAGTRLRYCVVNRLFLQLVRRAGLAPRSAACRPRLHDFRHTFAVRTVLDAYRADLDVGARLPVLSTYLGHVNPAATYWYLSAAPELLALAGERLERHLGDRR